MHLLGACLVVSSFTSFSQENTYNELLIELNQLLSDQKFEQAYQITQSQFQYLGEPEFDFLLGISALGINKPDPAVFAFERVVEINPHWHDARLYLVKSYLMVNNVDAASSHASLLINSPNVSQKIKLKAENLLAIAANKKRLSGSIYSQVIEWGIGIDSNVNAGTEEDTIFIPELGEFLLSQESKSADDNYTLLNYRGVYFHPLNQKDSVTLSINTGLYKFQTLDQYDRLNTQINATYQHEQDNTTWYVDVGLTPLILDGDLYRTESSFTTGADIQLSKQNNLFGSVTLGLLNNKLDEKLDNSFFSFNFGANHISESWFQSLSVNVKSESADIPSGEFNARQILGLYYQANTQLTNDWQLLTLAGYQWISYQDTHPLFLQDRDDDLLMFSGALRYLINRDFALKIAANYQDKTSNITLFEYDRIDFNVSLAYSF